MKIFVLMGPSAAGKTTLENYLASKGFGKIVTTTTRPIGKDEIEGEDYHFVTAKKFQNMLENNQFAEHDYNYGNSYGITKVEFEKSENLVAVLNLSGALSVKKIFPDCTYFIFVQPPSLKVLEERIIKRGRDKLPGAIKKRLSNAEKEIREWSPMCDFSVLADVVEIAKRDLEKIVSKIIKEN